MTLLFALLLGCPADPDATDTDGTSAPSCPAGRNLTEDDLPCTCGGEDADWEFGCATAQCVDDQLVVDDTDCCKAVDGCGDTG